MIQKRKRNVLIKNFYLWVLKVFHKTLKIFTQSLINAKIEAKVNELNDKAETERKKKKIELEGAIDIKTDEIADVKAQIKGRTQLYKTIRIRDPRTISLAAPGPGTDRFWSVDR